jgi:GTP-binding protein Era
MVRYAMDALAEADLALVLVEPDGSPGAEDRLVLERVRQAGRPALLLVNKIDRVAEGRVLETLKAYGALGPFEEIVPISALTGRGVERLEGLIVARLAPGPPFFEPHQVTDQPEPAIVAELVRQEAFRRTHREVPYQTAVRVERMEARGKHIVIEARIFVERDSQKGILIGKGGAMLKAIGTAARKKIEPLLGAPVHLALEVRVLADWSRNPRRLAELGYPEA